MLKQGIYCICMLDAKKKAKMAKKNKETKERKVKIHMISSLTILWKETTVPFRLKSKTTSLYFMY